MAAPKRKRAHDEIATPNKRLQPAPTRRTTRHMAAVAPQPEDLPEKQLRSGRVRANTIEEPQSPTSKPAGAHKASHEAPKTKSTAISKAAPHAAPPKSIRRTRAHDHEVEASDEELGADEKNEGKENDIPELPYRGRKHTAVPPPQIPPQTRHPPQKPKPQAQAQAQAQAAGTTPQRFNTAQPQPRPRAQVPTPIPPPTTPTTSSAAVITPKRQITSTIAPLKPPSTPRPDRNIDKVVLGDICFRAWYPSYYGKEVLGDASGNAGAKGNGAGGKAKMGGGKKDKEMMLDRLYVCPCCFKYSKEIVSWWEHVKFCEKKARVPGRKIYTHPKGKRTLRPAPYTPVTAPDGFKRRGRAKSIASTTQPGTVEILDKGEWSVWEVDGEQETLFCQNLSLFAKLFLDNKSVFFDVAGFNYFLLVYTTPPSQAKSQTANAIPPSRPHIVGFFSKEKMSWDNNNLACILVFPPWQRKGLGSILMGVSYEISRREGVLGGPEKPISDLGRKGYKRFWAGEIARWLLSLDVSPGASSTKETLVTVDDCSKETWIVPEDCLQVLREMGVVEEAGMGPPKRINTEDDHDEIEKENGEKEIKEVKEVKDVPRVRVDKAAVRRWIKANGIDLERTCDPDGFVEGYAIPEVKESEEE